MLLLLSILALFLGPLTYRLLQRQPGWLDLLDAFIFVTISGLVLFDILPELLHTGGLFVLVVMLVGLFAPSWIEKYFHKVAHQAHQATLLLGILGLVLHASIDGSVLLVEQGDHTGWLLALGVLLHRFPIGITIWWLLRPQYGRLFPLVILCGMSVATLVGALFGEYSLAQLDGQKMAWLQAFVMGSIMHVVIHRPYLHGQAAQQIKQKDENKYSAGIGSIAGLIVLAFVLLPHWLGFIEHGHSTEPTALHNEETLVAVEDTHEHVTNNVDAVVKQPSLMPTLDDHARAEDADFQHASDEHVSGEHESDEYAQDQHASDEHVSGEHQSDQHISAEDAPSNTALTLYNFANIALYSAPMLLIAYFLSALMHYFKPKLSTIPLQDSRSFLKDAFKGVIYGLPLPICSPSATKMHQQLTGMGANQTFSTAFLIAAPIIGFDALLISLPLLGPQIVMLRVILAAVFALLIGWLLGRHFKTTISPAAQVSAHSRVYSSRFIDAIKHGYQHQLDHTAPWVLMGWVLASALSAGSAWAFFDQALWLQVLLMILVAFPFALCATGITPVIAILLLSGLSPGAAIAFLLIAPAISLELLKKLKQQQGFFAAMSLALLMLGGAFVIGLGINQYINVITLPWLGQHQGDYGWWQYISLAVILVLYFVSLLRRGARHFIAELVPNSLLKGHHHH